MHRNRVAVLVDGGYFLKRLRYAFPDTKHDDPKAVAAAIHTHAIRHRYQLTGQGPDHKPVFESFDLYRIFFYDCPPLEKKLHYPISKKAVDFAKSDEAVFRRALHQELLRKRKVALRLGHLIDTTAWRMKASTQTELLKRQRSIDDLQDSDFVIDTGQKGVDMRLGLDVAALSYKKLVDQIVLIVGDSDFVPAAKLARREGIDVIIDPLGQKLHDHLFEHTDGVRTPKRLNGKKVTAAAAPPAARAMVTGEGEDEDDI